MKHKKADKPILSTAINISTGQGGSGIPGMPSVTFDTDHYVGTCCALSFGGNNYNTDVSGADFKSCVFVKGTPEFVNVSAPSGLYPEPVILFSTTNMDFDGTDDIDVILVNQSGGYTTFLVTHNNLAGVIALINPPDLIISSVFTHNGYGSDYSFNAASVTSAGARLWGTDGAGSERVSVFAPPFINANGVNYEGSCCGIVYGGHDYADDFVFNVKPKGYSIFTNMTTFSVGMPSQILSPEPVVLTGIGYVGTENISAILFNGNGGKYIVAFDVQSDAAATAAFWENVQHFGTLEKIIDNVFVANGLNADYIFNVGAITSTGGTLWGGDGANGERLAQVVISSTFPAGFTIDSFVASDDIQIAGISCDFVATGADKMLRAYLQIDGVTRFAVPAYSGSQNTFFPIPGRVHCPVGGTVALIVASDNLDGGTARSAFSYVRL